MMSLSGDKKAYFSKSFTIFLKFLDYPLDTDNVGFGVMFNQIYPSELRNV